MQFKSGPCIYTHPRAVDIGNQQSGLLPRSRHTSPYAIHSPIEDLVAMGTEWGEEEDHDSHADPHYHNYNNSNNKNNYNNNSTVVGNLPEQTASNIIATTIAYKTGTSTVSLLTSPTDSNTTINTPNVKPVIPLFDVGYGLEQHTPRTTGDSSSALPTAIIRTPTPTGTLPPAPGSVYTASRIKYRHTPYHNTSNLENDATGIIAAAELPVSMMSVVDCITEGQPQLPYLYADAETNPVRQPYTQIHPPPHGCSWEPPRRSESGSGNTINNATTTHDINSGSSGNNPLLSAMKKQLLLPPLSHSHHMPLQTATSTAFMTVTPTEPRVPFPPPLRLSSSSAITPAAVLRKPKAQTEPIRSLLYFHAKFFPPPPPPRLPLDNHCGRAQLWYHYASAWDVTHRLPPPPRTPLPEIELARRQQLPEFTCTPYQVDRWLKIAERWYEVTQRQFDYPEENIAVPISKASVLCHVIVE